MDAAQFVRDKINQAIPERFKNLSRLAEEAGVNQPNLNEFMKGNRKSMNLETAWKIFTTLGMEHMNDSSHTTPTIRRMGAYSSEFEVKGNDLVTVPIISAVGCGPGQYELVENKTIQILREFVHPGLQVCQFEGDSMEPIIMNGGYVGVIPLERAPRDGGIYVIYDDVIGLVTKYVYYGGQGKYVLKSENPNSPEIDIGANGYENLIIGEVVWVWHNFKRTK